MAIVDVHAHLRLPGDEPMTPAHDEGVEGLLGAVRLPDVCHATAIVIARRDDPATPARNDAVLAAAEATDGFLVPVVSVHPHDDGALAEVDRVAAAGARMVKLHPVTQGFDVADAPVAEVVARAGERGLVVLFDGFNPFDADQPGKLLALAARCGGSRLLLAHLNGTRFADLLTYEIAARYPWWPGNVWHDLSATAPLLAGGPFAAQFRWVVERLGAERVLHGSDWPLTDPAVALDAVRSLGFAPADERRILHDNAAALLGLGCAH
ncbi:amidohydrolase family protein [Asanoa sp. WMMD1127]|uniref:amidohydrolase family protein n=1 Tax=Asanoa sp. WMMD1127 TaxID=3016107 RepID=UPI00241696EE|nr:amidohydrolase family protein [Asanoa sp. WMMD1127]MDG4823535.1 amidohydrolase family protein [Asanoa sp. WMMD1127]